MKKIFLTIAVLFTVLFTSCMSYNYVEESYEIKKSNDLTNDIAKYGKPNTVTESSEKGYYVKTCVWNNVNGEEITCQYSSIEMRTSKISKPNGFKKSNTDNIKRTNAYITDYQSDVKRFGYPNDVSTYSSVEYYSKTCTWYNASGKYRSYEYNQFGKRTSTFESSPIR